MLSQPLIHLRIEQAKTQLAHSKIVSEDVTQKKHTFSFLLKCPFLLLCRIIISASITSALTQNEKCGVWITNFYIASIQKWKNEEYHLPQGNFSSTTVCDSIALCYGRLMDNVALIQLQMNRQDSRIKDEEGALGV